VKQGWTSVPKWWLLRPGFPTLRFHLTPVRIASATPPTGVGEDAGKKEPSYTVGGNVN
jgi:hypothetical protein